MDLWQVAAREVREVMGPDGRPTPLGRYEIVLDTTSGVVVLTTDTYSLRQLHAMLDPWARALAEQKTGHSGEVKDG